MAEREVIPLSNNFSKLDWQTLRIRAIDAKRVSCGVANHSLLSDTATSPKAKVTRSNRVGCTSFSAISAPWCAECDRFTPCSPTTGAAAW
jgi:hypothetical protein